MMYLKNFMKYETRFKELRRKDFDVEVVLRTIKMRRYGNLIKINFHDGGLLAEKIQCLRYSLISIDSV